MCPDAASSGRPDRPDVSLEEKLRVETAAREKAEQAVREMEEELRALSYSLAHDLRAPLRTMHGFGELLLRDSGQQLSVRGQDYLERIMKASERLDQLIQDVLMCCGLRQVPIQLEPINVEILLRDLLAERLDLRPPSVTIEIQSPLLTVSGHTALLAQCLSHLLDNAVKFVAPGTQPRIRIWSQPLGARVRLWVEDNGVGIPRESQEFIFGLFHPAHGWEAHTGTDIGLTLVGKAARRMGGSVGVESEPGKRSRFWIEFEGA